jgi:O-antigen/teichoic acid export membrane protein
MNIVNGANHMRTFAVLQSARYVAMMISLIVFMSAGWPSHLLAVIITISEFSLLLLTIPCANRVVSLLSQFHKGWARHHLSFGLRGAFAGAVTELNTRIDVIVIGAIMSERWAGIYSVALLAFEGASQVIVAIRYNLNPRLTKFVTEHAVDDFRSFARRVIFMMTLLMFAVSAAAAIAYPFFVEWIMGDASYMAAFPALCIMLAAQTVTSGFVAMNMLLIQGNKPGAQSMYMVLVLAANLFGNILLVPIYGMSGAAIATGISFFVSAVALAVLARKHFGLSFL